MDEDIDDVILEKTRIEMLLESINSNDYDDIIKLINEGVNVNEKNSEGDSPLHIAAQKGNLLIVNYLLEHRANVNAVNNVL